MMKAKLIKVKENFVLEVNKKDIPVTAKTVGQAGRNPVWVIIAATGEEHPYLKLSLKNCQEIELLSNNKFTEKDLHKAYELGHNIEREDCFEKFLEWKNSVNQTEEWDVEIKTETFPVDRAPDGWETLPVLDENGYLTLKRL